MVSGADLSENAVAWVQICPLAGTKARPFKLSLTAMPGSWNVITSPDLMLVPTELKSNNAESLLRDLLGKMGYANALSNEITGSVRVMESALTGPKGVILKGQIDSIQVLETKIDYGYPFDQSQSSATWVQSQELGPCQ